MSLRDFELNEPEPSGMRITLSDWQLRQIVKAYIVDHHIRDNLELKLEDIHFMTTSETEAVIRNVHVYLKI